jgi:hypothetical protein
MPRGLLTEAVAIVERKVNELPAVIAQDPDKARAILSERLTGAGVVKRKEGVFIELALDPGRLLGIEDRGGAGGTLRAYATAPIRHRVK